MAEFDLIKKFLTPLAKSASARGLIDDVAILDPRAQSSVVTSDTLVEGVHFLTDDPLDTVAQKLVTVNVSDLFAKGVIPKQMVLNCAWPHAFGEIEIAAFATGLARAFETFGIDLIGGDTVRTRGPLVLSATLFGAPLRRNVPERAGAEVGQSVWVSGVIGDGFLGLLAADERREEHHDFISRLNPSEVDEAVQRFQVPALAGPNAAKLVAEYAIASMDVSDGLLADAAHIARASKVTIEVELADLPISDFGERWLYHHGRPDWAERGLALATGGDDYQILMTCKANRDDALQSAADKLGVAFTKIGTVIENMGTPILCRGDGEILSVGRMGWEH